MWKVGVIGTGYWSEKHLKAWQRIPNASIQALCNRSKDKLVQKAEQFDVSTQNLFTSLDEMLAKADIDIVDIITGPETHLEFVTKAAQAGKHILCQKPFAVSLEEAEQMVAVAEANGVKLMVTENWRWLQPFQAIKKVLDSDCLGAVQTARYHHSDFFTTRMSPDRTLPQPFLTRMPQLIFYEMGVHWFDTWRFLFGEPKRLYAELKTSSPYIVGEDTGIVTLGYDDFFGFLDMSWATRRELTGPLEQDTVLAHHKESFVIDGTLATLKWTADGQIIVIDNQGQHKMIAETTELDHEESHYRLQSHFIECLHTGKPFQTSGADNLKTLRLAFATYQSSKEQRAIQF
ncbi:Gfo/Idh/MocA family protein [Paenibacillus thalictri]|uniref:Gfo/Idh/MocA family oxidoreductase n=1 Tax=Paenibacillus thalictri TaxID=2527873 RepID=A0A4Q9DI79_9BACL|nr:Gfo/Idh/MocA family oxidoreductase [Paenibacillus thalictri]TBL70301.1 Gfo/Idh/MocA family oxidoreductase [Paenibacillus thalictri]